MEFVGVALKTHHQQLAGRKEAGRAKQYANLTDIENLTGLGMKQRRREGKTFDFHNSALLAKKLPSLHFSWWFDAVE
jgi:hypothetical protein